MPEGPEVRCIAISMDKSLSDRTVTSIQYDSKSKLKKTSFNVDHKLPSNIINISCKGKRIIMKFKQINNLTIEDEDYWYLTCHLGMEGKWTWIKGPHSNLWFQLQHENCSIDSSVKQNIIYFDDSRHFGSINFFDNTSLLQSFLDKKHGPDILANAIAHLEFSDDISQVLMLIPNLEKELLTEEKWMKIFKNKSIQNRQLCDILLCQEIFGGIGNYLKCEIMYACEIKPDKLIKELTDSQIELLRCFSFDIIYRSFKSQGLTIKSYWDLDGNKGTFECLVYEKNVDPNGFTVIKNTFKDKRTTHWVPEIQV